MEFLYEIGTDGGVIRSIELMGVDLVPVGAASWAEICEAQEFRYQPMTLALARYKDQFGGIPEGNVRDWEDAPHEEITEVEFERWWTRARAHLDQRPRSEHFA